MGCLGCGDDWGVGNEREMDTRIWNQVGLELIEINVEGSIETERCGDRGDNYLFISISHWRLLRITNLEQSNG